MAMFALVGLALASLAALAWQVGRPIDVPPDDPAVTAPPKPQARPPVTESRAAPVLEAIADDSPPSEVPPPARKGGIRRGDFPGLGGREGALGVARPSGFRRLAQGTRDPVMAMQMDEANQLYQRGQYPEAKEKALLILSVEPENARMLRVVVSSACMLGEAAEAISYYGKLTIPRDRLQMQTRCRDAGIDLPAD